MKKSQLPHSCEKGRSETGVWSGGWKDALGETYRALQWGRESINFFIWMMMGIDIEPTIPLMPGKGSQDIVIAT